tara:strand:- start:17328 stop:17681 length:354 start_codon:yes stop_codon:yes gene_type:complete
MGNCIGRKRKRKSTIVVTATAVTSPIYVCTPDITTLCQLEDRIKTLESLLEEEKKLNSKLSDALHKKNDNQEIYTINNYIKFPLIRYIKINYDFPYNKINENSEEASSSESEDELYD